MGNSTYPYEGLFVWLLGWLQAQQAISEPALFDVVTANTTPIGAQSTYASITGGVVSAQFAANSALNSGNNVLKDTDFTIEFVLDQNAIAVANSTVEFTNISGADLEVTAVAIYVFAAIAGPSVGTSTLLQIKAVNPPIVVSANATISFTPVVGDTSVNQVS